MWTEQLTTACNMLANMCMLYRIYTNAAGPVPCSVLSLQVTANLGWMLYAHAMRDLYLFTTASSSCAMQLLSLMFLVHNRVPLRKIKLVDSETELPCVVPLR